LIVECIYVSPKAGDQSHPCDDHTFFLHKTLSIEAKGYTKSINFATEAILGKKKFTFRFKSKDNLAKLSYKLQELNPKDFRGESVAVGSLETSMFKSMI
jgi:hypothetical protein